jgi:hypothetical protein
MSLFRSSVCRDSMASPLAILLLGLLLAPMFVELGHLEDHAVGAVVLHEEASHPDAAPHFEQEEHLRPEPCPVCLKWRDAPAEAHDDSGAFRSKAGRVFAPQVPSLPASSSTTPPSRGPPA